APAAVARADRRRAPGPSPGGRSTRKLAVRHPVGPSGLLARAADLVFLIGLEIALEPFDLGVALEREDMRCEAVEEEAVVADDHRAAGEILDRFLERAQGLDVEVVGRLIE